MSKNEQKFSLLVTNLLAINLIYNVAINQDILEGWDERGNKAEID